MRSKIPILKNSDQDSVLEYIKQSKIRRLTFAYKKWSSTFRLVYYMLFVFGNARYNKYLDLIIARESAKANRLRKKNNKIQVFDEHHPDKIGYIKLVHKIEEQIEDTNPTFN